MTVSNVLYRGVTGTADRLSQWRDDEPRTPCTLQHNATHLNSMRMQAATFSSNPVHKALFANLACSFFDLILR